MNLKVLNGFDRIRPEDLSSFDKVIESRDSKIGFDRVYEDNEPERGALNGRGKIRLTKRERSQQKMKSGVYQKDPSGFYEKTPAGWKPTPKKKAS